MREIPPVDVSFADKEESARALASAVVELREKGYSPRKRIVDLDSTAETTDELFEKASTATAYVKGAYGGLGSEDSYGVGLANPESGNPFENFTREDREAYREAMRRDLPLLESVKTEIPGIEFPYRDGNEQVLVEAREALEDSGFDFRFYRVEGSASMAPSSMESLDIIEQVGAEFQIFVEEPREDGTAFYSTHIHYTDDRENGYFKVDTAPIRDRQVTEGIPGMEEWDGMIETALEDAGFPVQDH